MNIAYILNSTAINGGATKAFLNILDGLSKYDIRPYVVVPDKDGVFHELSKRQIPTFVHTYRSSTYPDFNTLSQRLLFLPRLAARIVANHRVTNMLVNWLRENKINIVHSNTGVVRIGFDAAQRVGLPHIYHIREYQDKIGLKYFPTKNSFNTQLEKDNSFSICITKDIQNYYGQKNKKTSKVIYDGVFHFATVLPKEENKDFFLFAGRIQPAKGPDQLLKAYKLYICNTTNPLHLKLAGSISDNAYYQSLINFTKENGMTDMVEFLGECHDISDLMRKARALIISSPFEGFGFCMPEAMQQGCLCIGRNTGGTKEQLDNALEMTGCEIALRYETTEQLADLLYEVASHPTDYYQPYVERAFSIVNKLYTAENNAEKIYQFYKDILYGTDS